MLNSSSIRCPDRRNGGREPAPQIISFACVLMVVLAGCGSRAVPPVVGELSIVPTELELTAKDESNRQQDVTCRLVNRSDKSVRIVNVSTSCACTLTEPLAISTLAPNMDAQLRLRVSIPSHGRKEVVVRVETSPPSVDSPSIRLILIGPERKLPYVESPVIDLRLTGHRAGEWVAQECDVVTVEEAETTPWIKGVAAPDDAIQASMTLPPSEELYGPMRVRRTYRLAVRGQLPAATERPRSHTLVIATDDRLSTSATDPYVIRATTVLEPLVRIVPKEISFHRSRIDHWPVVRNVMLVGPPGNQLSFDVIEPLPSWIEVGMSSDSASKQNRLIRVVIHEPLSDASRVTETIRFTVHGTNDGDTIAEIPISVIAN